MENLTGGTPVRYLPCVVPCKLYFNAGITSFSMASRYDSTLTATNFLKKDKNYYAILDDHWASLRGDIKRIFEGIMSL